MIAVLATGASLLWFFMADWGKGLYAVTLQGLGSVLDREWTISQERLELSKILLKVWMPRCRSMTKEEKVSNHGQHLLKVVFFMNRQSLNFVEQIFCGGYFFTLVSATPSALLFGFLSFSLPVISQLFFFFTGCFCLATQPLDYGENRRWLCAPHSGRCAWGVPPYAGHRLRRGGGSKMSPSPLGWPASEKWHSHWPMQTCLTAHWRPGSGGTQRKGRLMRLG